MLTPLDVQVVERLVQAECPNVVWPDLERLVHSRWEALPPWRAALIQRAPSTSCLSGMLTCMIFYLKAGITSSVRSFKLRCTASGGSNPPGLSSAVNPVRPSISLYWVKRSMTRSGLPTMTLVSRISS